MADIRPKDLPVASTVDPTTGAFVVDNGVTVERTSATALVDAAVPLVSQAVAEAGASNDGRMSPLRVAQYVSGQLGGSTLPVALGNKANASAIGIAGSAANMGTYAGTTIPDNQTAKQNIQSLETAVEARASYADLAADSGAGLVGFSHAETYAPETAGERFQREILVTDAPYSADPTGTASSDSAFAGVAATGSMGIIPDGSYSLSADVEGYWNIGPQVVWTGAGRAVAIRRGFWADDATPGMIERVRDRALFGDAAKHTGNRLAPLGGTWMTEYGASYFEKNAQVVSLSSETGGRIGFMAGSYTAPGDSGSVNMGIGSFSLNAGEASTGRAFYAEAFHKGNAIATVGLEVQGGDWTSVDNVAGAYGVSGGYIGVSHAVEAGFGYTTGDANTPVPAPTKPGNLAMDVAGGSPSASNANYRWRTGLVFRTNSLFRGGTGLSGTAKAISLAQQHEVVWEASSSLRGAVVRSDVTAVADQDVGILFKNNAVQITGTTEIPMAAFTRDTVGSPVNYLQIKNARTGIAPHFDAIGTDTNIGLDFQAKGTGSIRMLGQGGAAETMRFMFNGSYVNFLTATGSVTAGGAVTLGAGGSDTNLDILFSPKGAGNVRFGTHAAVVAEVVTGYITIKDAGGTLRKLAVIS